MVEKSDLQQMKLLTEYTEDLLWIMDNQMKVEYMSPSVELHSGFTLDETLNLPLYTFYTPESVDIIINGFQEELLRGKDLKGQPTTRRVELEAYKKDGSTDWVEIQATFIRDEQGNIDKIVGVTRKITERKQAEQHRIDYVRALVHELKSPLTAVCWQPAKWDTF